MTGCRSAIAGLTLPLALTAAPALAQGYSDPSSGLAIAPPAGLSATVAAPRPNYDVTVVVSGDAGFRSVEPNGQLCSVGFKNAPQNTGLTRAEINAQMMTPEWRNLYKATFELFSTVTRTRTITHQGYTGLEFLMTPKAGPNAANIRIHVASIETPKGRTVVSCATDAANLRKAEPIFTAIRRGTTVPE